MTGNATITLLLRERCVPFGPFQKLTCTVAVLDLLLLPLEGAGQVSRFLSLALHAESMPESLIRLRVAGGAR